MFEDMETRMRQAQYESFQNANNAANATPPVVFQGTYKPANPTPYNGMPNKFATVDSACRGPHAALAYYAP
jgi:hypothetical protein